MVDAMGETLTELRGAAEGLRVAHARISEVIGLVETRRRRLGAQGFRGVAANMSRIDRALAANQAAVTDLATVIDQMLAAASRVGVSTTPDQALTTLKPLVDHLERARSAARRLANADLPATQATTRQVLSGGQPEHLCARIDQVTSVVHAVERRLAAACAAAQQAIAAARNADEVGRDATASDGDQGHRPRQPVEAPDSGSDPEPVGANAPIPSFVHHIVEGFQHVGPGSRQTVGYLADRDGTPLHDGRILSGTDGPARGGPGLISDHPIRRWDVVERHVEGHAAALMRRPGAPREAVLVVSRRPCRGDWGCEWALPRIIPDQSVLHIYLAAPGQEVRYYNSYPGNGRAVQTQ